MKHRKVGSLPEATVVNQLLFLAAVFAFVFVGVAPGVQLSSSVQAQVDPDNLRLRGYVWSSTTGWASFCGGDNAPLDCPGSVPYQSFLHNSTGDFSGWAWSSSLGWLSFDRRVTGNPPSDDVCQGSVGPNTSDVHFDHAIGCIDVDTKEGKGWARFMASCDLVSNPSPENPPHDSWVCGSPGAGSGSSAWDGWVKLGGNAQDGTDFAIMTTPDRRITSFGWGSNIQGWTNFDTTGGFVTTPDDPTIQVSLDAQPRAPQQVPAQVRLTATIVQRSSNNPIDYIFECGNDTKEVLQSRNLEEEVVCTYTIPDRHTVSVTVLQDGIFDTARHDFAIGEELIFLPAGREEFTPEDIPTGIFDDPPGDLFQ